MIAALPVGGVNQFLMIMNYMGLAHSLFTVLLVRGMVMTTMHDDAAYEAIFRKYWRRWMVLKCVFFCIVLLVSSAYAILMTAVTGYASVIGRDASALPLVLIVIIGILFLIDRPWSFTAYLDRVIARTTQKDARIAKKYAARQDILDSFHELETEMRRRNSEPMPAN